MSYTSTPPSTPPGSQSGSPSAPPSPPSGNGLGDMARSFVGGMVPKLLSVGVVIALSAGAYWFFVVHGNSKAVAESLVDAGKCFSWTDADGAKVLPCTDDAAFYKSEGSDADSGGTSFSTTGGSTCDALGAYVTFDVTSTARNDSQTGTICGVLNVAEGDCLADGGDPPIVACSDPGATGKVLSIEAVASKADALSDDKAQAVCGKNATTYLSDAVGKAIVCVGDAA